MPVYHHGDPAEGSLGLFGSQPAEKSRLQKRMEAAEDAAIKREVLARYREGERLADPATGAIALVDASAPRGLPALQGNQRAQPPRRVHAWRGRPEEVAPGQGVRRPRVRQAGRL